MQYKRSGWVCRDRGERAKEEQRVKRTDAPTHNVGLKKKRVSGSIPPKALNSSRGGKKMRKEETGGKKGNDEVGCPSLGRGGGGDHGKDFAGGKWAGSVSLARRNH